MSPHNFYYFLLKLISGVEIYLCLVNKSDEFQVDLWINIALRGQV
jgi:hypothetical protein